MAPEASLVEATITTRLVMVGFAQLGGFMKHANLHPAHGSSNAVLETRTALKTEAGGEESFSAAELPPSCQWSTPILHANSLLPSQTHKLTLNEATTIQGQRQSKSINASIYKRMYRGRSRSGMYNCGRTLRQKLWWKKEHQTLYVEVS
eukprot:940904-Pleurochrysis_carterae.AAC.1